MEVARWFVAWAKEDEADISNLKLQKILYYAQGHYLARNSSPLFNDDIQAWAHGPVVPAVYHAFKNFGSGDVEIDEAYDWSTIDDDSTQFLIEVWATFGQYGAWRLRQMTHEELPWKKHFVEDMSRIVIPQAELREFFAAA